MIPRDNPRCSVHARRPQWPECRYFGCGSQPPLLAGQHRCSVPQVEVAGEDAMPTPFDIRAHSVLHPNLTVTGMRYSLQPGAEWLGVSLRMRSVHFVFTLFTHVGLMTRLRLAIRPKPMKAPRRRLRSPMLKASFIRREVKGGLAAWRKKRLADYIEQHLAERISIVTLADIAGLSPYHFARAFKQSFGIPPYRYQMMHRMEYAKVLLARPGRR